MQCHNLYDPFLTIPCGFAPLDTGASGSPLPVPNGDLHDYAQYTHADFRIVDGVDGEMEGDEESDEAETGDNLRSHSESADSTKPKGSKKCTETGPTMASTATPQQQFNGALNGAQPDCSPYGFTSFYPLQTTALVLGLEMTNGVKLPADHQSSMSTLTPLMSTYNGSFRLSDTHGLTGTRQPQSVSSSSSKSLNPQTIFPDLLRTDGQQSTVPSLPIVSGDELPDSESEYDYAAGAAGRRTKSDGDVGFALLDGDLDSRSSNEGDGPSPGKKRRRKLKSSSGSDMKRYKREAKARGVEKQKEMAGFELGPTKGNKRAKRRMQNRLAQRAFRARSKIQNKEVANRMSHLETLAKAQAERLHTFTELVDRLQRENTWLKQARWSSGYGD